MSKICFNLLSISLKDSTTLYFFFNDTATTEIYTLSLHDALPISIALGRAREPSRRFAGRILSRGRRIECAKNHWTFFEDRKSTRLNSSHSQISYAVFCLKKKRKISITPKAESLTPLVI